ncbi:hypothetical protein, partial [Parasutterella excrementihominis]|uniref:hypothetical protein n=1 Tax=Parasutterella excrementihominis TaxID=487175 RepID=UPI003AB66393
QTHLTSNKIPRQPKKYGNRSCFARLKKNFILKCLTTTGVPEIGIYLFVMVCCFTVYGIYKIKKSKAKKNKKE